jgi:hypothetical protein
MSPTNVQKRGSENFGLRRNRVFTLNSRGETVMIAGADASHTMARLTEGVKSLVARECRIEVRDVDEQGNCVLIGFIDASTIAPEEEEEEEEENGDEDDEDEDEDEDEDSEGGDHAHDHELDGDDVRAA